MPTARLPKNCDLPGLLASFDRAGLITDGWDALVIQVPPRGFIGVDAMTFLCAWASGRRASGRRILLRGDEDTLRYLARMDLHENLGIDYVPGDRQDEVGRFLPLKRITDGDDVHKVVSQICNLVLHQLDDAAAFVPAMEWAINEIVDNIVIHAESVEPGTVCAQYFPKKHRLDVGICDLGRGIKASLETSRRLRSHGHAVETALMRGVTRDPDVGQGNGMAGALEIASCNGGQFSVWTGNVVYRQRPGRKPGFTRIPMVPGTGIMFSLDTRRPVDLADTWIAAADWSYIDAEAERVEEAGGFDVAAACINIGSRPPAQRLRRKLLALLPAMDSPLVLDFTGVTSPSSSFLDELLGRMAAALGPEEFNAQVRCVGMGSTVRNMANVVIAQRLGDVSLPLVAEESKAP